MQDYKEMIEGLNWKYLPVIALSQPSMLETCKSSEVPTFNQDSPMWAPGWTSHDLYLCAIIPNSSIKLE